MDAYSPETIQAVKEALMVLKPKVDSYPEDVQQKMRNTP